MPDKHDDQEVILEMGNSESSIGEIHIEHDLTSRAKNYHHSLRNIWNASVKNDVE